MTTFPISKFFHRTAFWAGSSIHASSPMGMSLQVQAVSTDSMTSNCKTQLGIWRVSAALQSTQAGPVLLLLAEGGQGWENYFVSPPLPLANHHQHARVSSMQAAGRCRGPDQGAAYDACDPPVPWLGLGFRQWMPARGGSSPAGQCCLLWDALEVGAGSRVVFGPDVDQDAMDEHHFADGPLVALPHLHFRQRYLQTGQHPSAWLPKHTHGRPLHEGLP